VTTNIQAIRGMNDILPEETEIWQYIENILRQTLRNYGYDEIRLPLLEKTELFKRSIGEATDIVEKEMYTFLDRNGDNLTIRPEGTAGCVRAGIEHGLFYNQLRRLWYMGPFYRYERPQKGRYRQFYQCGAEVFGLSGPDIDAELILLSAHILEQLGLKPYVTLEINSLGSPAARAQYRDVLVHYLTQHQDQLDEDSRNRLTSNPLRILDSKNPTLQTLIHGAPKLADYLDEESREHFMQLCVYLDTLEISYKINPCLVRGLDYYTKTVFEWVTHELGAQGTVCAGGRYDGLVEQLGGHPTPALGFGMGMERVILLVQKIQSHRAPSPLHAYFVTDSEDTFKKALKLSVELRHQLPSLRLIVHCGGGGFKSQLKKADKSGALYALILGEQEQQNHTITLKSLRSEDPQQTIPQNELVHFLKNPLKLPG